MVCVAIFMTFSIEDFIDADVSFGLDSPTVSLDEVYFPSLVICNANTLRRSFIYSLLKDPLLQVHSVA